MISILDKLFKKKNISSLQIGFFSIKGNVRKINQDNLSLDDHHLPEIHEDICSEENIRLQSDSFHSFCIFDGMGGEECGEKASYLAAESFHKELKKIRYIEDSYRRTEGILSICQNVNNKIVDYAKENGIQSMGTTVAGIVFWRNQYYGFNLGDSPIYHYKDGVLKKMSKDHVLKIVSSVNLGLTQFLGIAKDEFLLSPEIFSGRLGKNESLLLCSDGVSKALNQDEIKKYMADPENMKDIMASMIHRINLTGSKDNASMMLIRGC